MPPKGARKAAKEAAAAAAATLAAATVEETAVEPAIGLQDAAKYTVVQAIEWGKQHYGDDEGWDDEQWQAWAIARPDVEHDQCATSTTLALVAEAEAVRPQSPTSSDLAMLAAGNAMDVCACQELGRIPTPTRALACRMAAVRS